MRRTALALAGLSLLSCRGDSTERAFTPRPLPALAADDAAGLPALPRTSARNANYTIDARLDPESHRITASAILEWRNLGSAPVSRFPFHLYLNAFRNTLSTAARGMGSLPPEPRHGERRFGWTNVTKLVRLPASGPTGDEENLTPTLRYLHEDGNTDDRTVAEFTSARPVAPGETAHFRIEWESLLPHGGSGRAGWVHDEHFVAQWFPKIGVLQADRWNAHSFHAWTEFFSDFGVYDVRLSVPSGFVVGATGRLREQHEDRDGTRTLRFVQEDVHDFAWVASRRMLERRDRFEDAGYPPVDIRLLLQPEHEHLARRYLQATKAALRTFGAWAAPYPYAHITVVDPAWGSASGGMEYPTLFTGDARILSPPALQDPEGVTFHEVGHQFWHGLVATNEFEEAWLDEGFTTYMTARALDHTLGAPRWGRLFFASGYAGDAAPGWPFVAHEVRLPRGGEQRPELEALGEADVMAKPGWAYRDRASYGLNSYAKPALVLQTLEGLLGEETMLRVLRTYARRFRFAHPTTADFVATVNEVSGGNWNWFFEQTFFSSDLCDYAVTATTQPARLAEGWFETAGGQLELRRAAGGEEAAVDSRVTLVRHGEVRLPVELHVEFTEGAPAEEHWDGRERWHRFEYPGRRVVRAVLDPAQKLAIDVDPVNDEWIASDGPARRAATKWAGRYLLWLQAFFEMNTVLG